MSRWDGAGRSKGPTIFFSYRRVDSDDAVRRLSEHLRADLGSQNVFRDKDDLIAGLLWREALDGAIDACDAALFVVGPGWVGQGDGGARRIDLPDDPVASEVIRAVRDGSTCAAMPILVGVDRTPPALPETVSPLFARHAIRTTETELFDRNSKAYQAVLVGVWESIRRRTPRGVLVIGDLDATAELDAVIAEMQQARLIDARRLSRFAAGACVVTARRLRKGARQWPEVIVLANNAEPTRSLAARLQAIDEHPGISRVGIVGAGVAGGFALGQVIGTTSSTTFTASSHVAPVVPDVGTGPLSATVTAWSGASAGTKTAVATVAVGAMAGGVVLANPQSGGDWEAPYGYLDVAMTSPMAAEIQPEGLEAPEGHRWVNSNVTLENPLRSKDLEVAASSLTLVTPSQRSFGAFEAGDSVSVPAAGSIQETVWWTVPDGTSLGDPKIEIREDGFEPLLLPAEGELVDEVAVTMEGSAPQPCGNLTFGEGRASYSARPTARADPVDIDFISPLGRAREGRVVIAFDVTATYTCTGIGFINVYGDVYNYLHNARVDDEPIAAADQVPRMYDPSAESGRLYAAVPEDHLTTLRFDYGENGEAGTVSADLTDVTRIATVDQ